MKYLAMHVDTTGINYDSSDPSDGHEIVAICLMVCDANFKVLKHKVLYNGTVSLKKLKASEKYHGINAAILEEVGIPDEEDFVFELASFIAEEFNDNVKCLGHNVGTFTLPFIKKLFDKYELPIRFSSNVLDTYSVLVPTVGDLTLNALIDLFGEDYDGDDEYSKTAYKCRLFVNIFKRIQQLWHRKIMITTKPQ